MDTFFLIYGLSDPNTNEIRYIGKSSTGLSRPKQHFEPSRLEIPTKKNSWIKSLMNNGILPKIVIVEELELESSLNEREIFWIKYYKDLGNRLTNGTNGGDGGNTGKSYLKYRPIISINLQTGTVKRYDYVWQTENDGFSPTKVVSVCKGRRISHKGHCFYYEGQPKPSPKLSKCKTSIRVKNKKTGKVQVFETIRKASCSLGIRVETISRTVNHHSKNRLYEIEAISSDDFYNVSVCDEMYAPANLPTVVEI